LLSSSIVDLGRALEEEYQLALQIFGEDGGIGGYSGLSIAVKVAEKLIQRLAQQLQQIDAEIAVQSENMMALLVGLDIIETMHECAPKCFMLIIKVKELPLKKATEQILVKAQ
jgi:hypothetical protein